MDMQMEAILQGGPFRKMLDEQGLDLRQKYNLKKAELEILYFLSRSGEHNTSTDIYYQLRMNRGHISQAVDSLCKRRFLLPIPDEADRRYIHYKVLDPAKDIVMEMTKRREIMTQRLLEGISEEELQTFRKVGLQMKKNIENMM